jgi:CRISPR system Cascade subunit CasC
MPTGKQNTFANRTLPDAVLVLARETQPINFVGAFENAIADGENGGRIGASVRRLVDHGREIHAAYDERPVAAWSISVGERTAALAELGEGTTFNTATTAIGDLVAQRLAVSS